MEQSADKMEHAQTEGLPWCYFYTQHTMVEKVNAILSREFNTFVHRSVEYRRRDKRLAKEVRQTISGLVFVQGHAAEVAAYLRERAGTVALVVDRATGRPAQVPDSQMRPFMRVAGLAENHVRIMPNPIGHYSDGHVLIRVETGLMAGLEGYVVRIARDHCLVTQIGNLTVAIGGVSKEVISQIQL